jgi:superfamily II DNA or RNA helicase
MPPELRPYQAEIVEQVRRLEHPIIPLPTGAGKTVIAAAIIEETVQNRRYAMFLAHRRELISQASAKLLAWGVDHAVLMGRESSAYRGEHCLVGSVPTLYSRAFRINRIERPPADIIFFDEAHHCRARTYMEIRNAYPKAQIIGLTATPARGDGAGLGNIFTDLVRVPTYAELIRQKYLVPPVVYAPVRPDLTGIRTLDTGDYSPSELEARMNTSRLVGGILEHWFKLGDERPTIVFTAGVKHSVHLSAEFRLAGVNAEHIDARTALDERKRIIAGFRSGDVKILCNCMIFTEGFDEPSASCLVLARPTKLLTIYRQMSGRVMRPYPGKADARILDHSGAVYRHGYPDDEIAWVLPSDGKAVNTSAAARAASAHKPELTTCPECAAVRMEGERCRCCGWKPETGSRHLEVAEGQLGAVQRDRSVHVSIDDPHVWHRQLTWIARARL